MLSYDSVVVLIFDILADYSHRFLFKNVFHAPPKVEILDCLTSLAKSVLDYASELECIYIKVLIKSILSDLVFNTQTVLDH